MSIVEELRSHNIRALDHITDTIMQSIKIPGIIPLYILEMVAIECLAQIIATKMQSREKTLERVNDNLDEILKIYPKKVTH